MKAKIVLNLCWLLLINGNLWAQGSSLSDRQGEILFEMTPRGVQFSAVTPPLGQIAGAPPAFYSYFWEFGDGQFSFKERPLHIYPHAGEFETRLYLTNNYDDGKPPPTRPKKLYVKNNALASINSPLNHTPVISGGRSLKLQTNQDPRPDEALVCIFSYKNQQSVKREGRLYLFFNERKFKRTHFEFGGARTYHGETVLAEDLFSFTEKSLAPSPELWASVESGFGKKGGAGPFWVETFEQTVLENTLDEARSRYRDQKAWQFTDLKPGEERNLFIDLGTTEEMLVDTNAIISIQGVFVPEGNSAIEVFTLELPIVASHDPNHIAVSDTRVNFRRAKRNELTYKVRFQNTGEGPASEIRIKTSIPPGLEAAGLELLDYYPLCPICPEEPVTYSCLDTLIEENQVTFSFHNIYLPGIKQAGVFSRDSTKGFVKFKLVPEKNIKRIALNSRAEIYFDKNPSIRTNSAVTQFTGYALGFKAGVDVRTDNGEVSSYFIGATISPVKASKWYYQGEIMLGYGTRSERSSLCFEEVISSDDFPLFLFGLQETESQVKTIMLEVVPLQFRKNLLDLLSVGLGTQLSLVLDRQEESETLIRPELFEDEQCQFVALVRNPPPVPIISTTKLPVEGAFHFFADINAGMVKNGPMGGLRYLHSLNPNFSHRLQLYLNWKF